MTNPFRDETKVVFFIIVFFLLLYFFLAMEQIEQLQKELEATKKELEVIKRELEKTNNRLIFERHQHKHQFDNLRSSLIAKLQYNMKLELNDLTELSKGLSNPDDGRILGMYVENIKQVIENL